MDVTDEVAQMIMEFKTLAPSLSNDDVNDLFAMAEHDDGQAMVQETLTDWKMSKKLNESELQGLADWFSSLSPILKVGAAILAIL